MRVATPSLALLSLCLLLALALAPPAALAWGAAGHAIVATLAQSLLHPDVRAHLCTILPEFTAYSSPYPRQGAPHKHCHLATLASWPDTYKYRIPWSAHYHYVNPRNDTPPSHCTYGEDGGFANEENVLTSLVNYTRQVRDAEGYDRDVALRFVTHLMGDLHQPLHLTGRARGGNDVWVRFEGRKARLHSVWDGLILNSQIRALDNYTAPLPSLAFESALRGSVWDAYMRWVAVEGLGIVRGQWEGGAWWGEDWQQWATCPGGDGDGSDDHIDITRRRARAQVPLSAPAPTLSTLLYDGPTWHVDETDLPLCPLAWSKPMHPLVCKYAFASPVPASDEEGDEAEEMVSDGDGVGVGDGDGSVDAERRRRRRRRRPSPTPPHAPQPPLPPLAELDGPEYLGRINDEHVLQRQLAMGGVRLAAVLNSILLPEAQRRKGRGMRVWDQ